MEGRLNKYFLHQLTISICWTHTDDLTPITFILKYKTKQHNILLSFFSHFSGLKVRSVGKKLLFFSQG